MDTLEGLSGRIDELESREQIRDVLYLFTRSMDRGHAVGLKDCYHADAYDVHWDAFTGNAHEFAHFMTGAVRDVSLVSHEIHNPLIQLDGERAFVECRYTSRVRAEVEGSSDGRWIELMTYGRYLDVFERREGKWKIAHRRLVPEADRVSVIVNHSGRPPRPEAAAHLWPDDLVFRSYGILDMAPGRMGPAKRTFVDWLREFGERASSPAV